MKNLVTYLVLANIFTLLLIGCSSTPIELETADKYLQNHPDSSLLIIQSISPKLLERDENKALYGLILFQALDKNNLELSPDSLINFSLDYYEQENDKPNLAKCYFYKGRMYNYAKRYDEATELYLKALDYCQGKKNYSLMGKIFFDMGDICVLQGEYEEARKKFEKSVLFFNLDKQFVLASYRLLDIGKTYYYTKEYSKAHQIFSKAISNTNDSTLKGALYQEIGINFLASKKMDSAEFYLRKSLKFPINTVGLGIRNLKFAEIFYSTDNFDSAYLYAKKSLDYPTNIYAKRESYRLLANASYNMGDMNLAGEYMKYYQSFTDSVRKIESQTKSTVLEKIHITTENAKSDKKFLLILEWILPIVLILGITMLYNSKRKRKNKEKLLEQVAIELDQKQLIIRNTLLQKIEDTKLAYSKKRNKATPEERDLIDKEIYNKSVYYDKPESFSNEINQAFNNIVLKLQAQYPELSQKEINWCCLHLLNTPTSVRILLLDTTSEGLYKIKQRVASKLKLEGTKQIDSFLQTLISN